MGKIKIIFKPETIPGQGGQLEHYQRPDFETTEHNLPNQERLHGEKIKKIIRANPDGSWPVDKAPITQVFKPRFTIRDVTPEIKEQLFKEFEKTLVAPKFGGEITNESLIKFFRVKGKTDLSIAKYLEIDVNEVKKIN